MMIPPYRKEENQMEVPLAWLCLSVGGRKQSQIINLMTDSGTAECYGQLLASGTGTTRRNV
jgi:hypothetical protein